MTRMKATYKGGLRVECQHLDSGTTIITDAPVDNQGQGRSFSPTDLLATSLAACMLTIMGIYARTSGLDMEGATADIRKIMSDSPRKVAKIEVRVTMPDKGYTEADKTKLERAALACPVQATLKEAVETEIRFDWAR